MKIINIISFCIILFSFIGCGSEEKDASESLTRICKVPVKSHSGCCSSHGGFNNNNCEATHLLYEDGNRLVCDDGVVSPTCTY